MIYPVPRSERSTTLRSRMIGTQLKEQIPSALLLFLEPLRGIVQEISVVKPSTMLAFTPPAPVVQEIPKQLRALLYPEPTLTPRSILIGQRLDATSVTSIDVLFQRPRIGIVQAIQEFSKSHLIFVPIPDQVIPVDVLFQRPKIGFVQLVEVFNKSRLVSVPVPDVLPTFPFQLFLQPLRAAQYDTQRIAKSMFIDQRLDATQAPGDTSLLFLYPRRALQPPTPPESESTLIFGLDPIDPAVILFQRPTRGVTRIPEEFRSSTFIRVPVPDPPPPTPIDVLFQRPNIGILRLVEVFRPSMFVRVPVPDVIIPINVLFQRPRVGFVQFVEVFRRPRFVVVPVPDPVPAVNAQVFVVIAGTPGAINIRVLTEHPTITRVVIDTTAQKVVVVQDPAAIPVKVVI